MKPDISKLDTVDRILETALAKEREDYEFYGALLTKLKTTMVRELVEKLQDEEYKHIQMIEKMIAKLSLE
ncbi:MAG: ferritin family protein [Smithellaceae bacterium]|nr:ferritin family protein [Smithellaceae bacterium]